MSDFYPPIREHILDIRFQISSPSTNFMSLTAQSDPRLASLSEQYIILQYSTVQYSTVQYSIVQYITVQYGTVQYSTVQYTTVQYIT